MATLDDFERALLDTGGYDTPASGRRMRPLRRGIRAWWRFYVSGVLRILLSGLSTRLRRGRSQRAFSEVTFETVRAVESTGAHFHVEGGRNLAALAGTPRVYVANHSSLLETFNLPCILGAFGPLTIVAKRSLAKYPLFGSCLRAVDPILLDRRSARRDLADTLSQGRRHLAAGRSVLLFPQGTRAASFDPRKFNSLGAKLARDAAVPLVPIACQTGFAQPGRLIRDVGPIDPSRPVRYAIGPALAPTLTQAEIQKASTDFIASTLSAWESHQHNQTEEKP